MNSMNNSIQTTLGEAGLNQSEQEVYLAGTRIGLSTSAELIEVTGMPRSTVLAALRVLADVGLCQTARRDGRSLVYTMLPPAGLKTQLARQIRSLDEVMQKLDGLQFGQTETFTQEVHGQEQVQAMLELALRCKSRKWHIISPHNNALRSMPTQYTEYFKNVRAERQIESQTLWEYSSKKDIPLRDVLMRKPRYVPADFGDIPGFMLAFDDSLLTITQEKSGPTAILLQNAAVTQTFRLMFEMAWRSADKF